MGGAAPRVGIHRHPRGPVRQVGTARRDGRAHGGWPVPASVRVPVHACLHGRFGPAVGAPGDRVRHSGTMLADRALPRAATFSHECRSGRRSMLECRTAVTQAARAGHRERPAQLRLSAVRGGGGRDGRVPPTDLDRVVGRSVRSGAPSTLTTARISRGPAALVPGSGVADLPPETGCIPR